MFFRFNATWFCAKTPIHRRQHRHMRNLRRPVFLDFHQADGGRPEVTDKSNLYGGLVRFVAVLEPAIVCFLRRPAARLFSHFTLPFNRVFIISCLRTCPIVWPFLIVAPFAALITSTHLTRVYLLDLTLCGCPLTNNSIRLKRIY